MQAQVLGVHIHVLVDFGDANEDEMLMEIGKLMLDRSRRKGI
jgi:hypothetical protein